MKIKKSIFRLDDGVFWQKYMKSRIQCYYLTHYPMEK